MSAQKLLARVSQVVGVVLCGLVLVFGSYVFGAYIAVRSNSPIGPGGPFHLEDQNGKPVSDQDMKGRPFVVFFGYTHCPDICPTTLFEISEVMKSLGRDADRTGALFITVDPERDTPATLKDYLSNFDPHLRGLATRRRSIRRSKPIGSTQKKSRSRMATTRWTTPPSSISWTNTANSSRYST